MNSYRWISGLLGLAGLVALAGCELTAGSDPSVVVCETDENCSGDQRCLVATGECVECLEAADCESGKCNPATHVCEAVVVEDCTQDTDCPGALCRVGVCVQGKCGLTKAPDNTKCDDDDECTTGDQCLAGNCVGDEIENCGIGGQCDGKPDGTACDDGDDCTASDECKNGNCEGLAVPGCGFPEDKDQDGWTEVDGDCNDEDPTINPGAEELCDEIDNDCSGVVDEGCECFVSGCNNEICSEVSNGGDCYWRPEFECLKYTTCGNFGPNGACGWELNDEYMKCLEENCEPSEEICDGQDNDCNGVVDEGCGSMECGPWLGGICPDGYYCKLAEGACYLDGGSGQCVQIPSGMGCPKLWDPWCGCDGITYANECEMEVAQVSPAYYGQCVTSECKSLDGIEFGVCAMFMGYGWVGNDCVGISGCGCDPFCDSIFESMEECYMACLPKPGDEDNDGYTVDQGDCNDYNPEIYPGAEELCDSVDNNCNSMVDEGCNEPIDCESDNDCPPGWYCQVYCGNGWCAGECKPLNGTDNDGDGYLAGSDDCDDEDPKVYPGADELCDGVDNDCDGMVDEGCGNSCGGFVGTQCPPTQYCEFEAGSCGWADQMGVCKPKPGTCPLVYAPVCGCDNKTYINSCDAFSNGISIQYQGECQTDGCKDLTGVNFGMCEMILGFGLVNGTCTGLSGCSCTPYCDSIFQTLTECKDSCF